MRGLHVPHDVDTSHAAALPAGAKTIRSLVRLGPWIRADATWRGAILITGANFSRIRRSRGITHFHRTVTNCCIAQSNAAAHISGASGVAESGMESGNEDHIARGDGPPGHVAGFCPVV